jgi:hypothetical protein
MPGTTWPDFGVLDGFGTPLPGGGIDALSLGDAPGVWVR